MGILARVLLATGVALLLIGGAVALTLLINWLVERLLG